MNFIRQALVINTIIKQNLFVNSEVRQNKGNILKASVDYIKSLQDDQRKLASVNEQKKKTEFDLRKVIIMLNVSRI